MTAENDDNRETRILDIIEDLLKRKSFQREALLEKIAEEHPNEIEEIRQLLLTAEMAENLATDFWDSADERTPHFSASLKNSSSTAFNLPRHFGDYELVREIGRGGMGVVFEARQIGLGRTVALKMLLKQDWASASEIERFQKEAETAARLNHPHIVPVFEVGNCEGYFFFSMQYVKGKTLAERLRDGPIPPEEIARILIPVCEAVHAAHQQGLLHRDLKPSNILLDEQGHAYVSDFGLVKRISSEIVTASLSEDVQKSLTLSGEILGTPSYMSPEQASGSEKLYGPTMDVFSLGTILYSMLTGRPPFLATSPIETLKMVIEQDPLPPRYINTRVNRDLEMISLKCLQKPVDLRYCTPEELARDLRAYLENEPVSARSSRFRDVLSRAFRETHHVGILENWGLLWMWHSLVLLILCVVTNVFLWRKVDSRIPYLTLWTLGLGLWVVIFWNLRRRAGPITFVERQIAHLWAGSIVGSVLLFLVEYTMKLPVLSLSPALGIISGMVFLGKAAMLSGKFYIHAVLLFLTSLAMAVMNSQEFVYRMDLILFGFVSAGTFFFPGLKSYRQRKANLQDPRNL